MKIRLEEIITNKFREISQKKGKRDFGRAIIKSKTGSISIIAEIKLISPTEGKLGDENNAVNHVVEYEEYADAISVVVDRKYFGGSYELLGKVKKKSSLPILAKDFIVDPFQICEAKYFGADAVLLIAKIVSTEKLIQFVKLTKKLNIEPVVEVQTEQELGAALKTETRMIAVNARNLETFKVDVDRACRLLVLIPPKYVKLGFSGVYARREVEKYKKVGAAGVLVGTSLMKSQNPGILIKELKGL